MSGCESWTVVLLSVSVCSLVCFEAPAWLHRIHTDGGG